MDLSAAIPLVSPRPAWPVGTRTTEPRQFDETTNNGCGRRCIVAGNARALADGGRLRGRVGREPQACPPSDGKFRHRACHRGAPWARRQGRRSGARARTRGRESDRDRGSGRQSRGRGPTIGAGGPLGGIERARRAGAGQSRIGRRRGRRGSARSGAVALRGLYARPGRSHLARRQGRGDPPDACRALAAHGICAPPRAGAFPRCLTAGRGRPRRRAG